MSWMSDEMRQELVNWAKQAEQCKICQAWALLDKSGECAHCVTDRGNWTPITTN